MLEIYDYEELQLKAENIIIPMLKEKHLSCSDIEKILLENNISYARRVSKDLVWRLAEEGIAFFNYKWQLEIKCLENPLKLYSGEN